MSAINEFVGVAQMANLFAAMHFQGRRSRAISNLSADIRVAREAAKAFAESKHLPFNPNELYKADRPTYTIFREGDKWYPLEIHADQAVLLTHFGKKKKKNEIGWEDVEQAKIITQAIASAYNCDFMPDIGTSLDKIKMS